MINIAQPEQIFDNCNSYYTAQWTETIVVVEGCQKRWSKLDNQVRENSV